MADIEDKLAGFTSMVLAEVEKKKAELVKETEKRKKKETDIKENEFLEDAYDEIQRAVAKYSKENNERVLKVEMSLKKNILLRREEIIDEVFQTVEDKVKEYVKTEEYGKWLENKISCACREVGKGKKNVFVSEADMKYKSELEDDIKDITVMQAETDDFLGGATIYNIDRRVFADYTIKRLLDDERHQFLQSSGLTID